MSVKTTKEKFNQVIVKLNSPNEVERKQAIQWLARTQSHEAIAPLRRLYENDPSEDVRLLALKAIRYIKDQTQTIPTVKGGQALLSSLERKTMETRAVSVDQTRETTEAPVIQTPAHKRETVVASAVRVEQDEEDDTEAARPRHPRAWTKYGEPVDEHRLIDDVLGGQRFAYEDPDAENYVERENWEQARTLAQNAYNDYLHGEIIAGLSKLSEAIQLDRTVCDEAVMQKATVKLMNMPLDKAKPILLDESERKHFIKRRKRQLRGARMFTSWWSFALDTFAVFAVIFVGVGAFLLTLNERTNTLMNALVANRDYNIQVAQGEDLAMGYKQVNTLLVGHDTNSLLTYAVLTAVFGTLLVILGSLTVHLMARYAMRGDATLTETEANFTPTLAGFALVVLVTITLEIYLLYPQSYEDLTNGLPIWLPFGSAIVLLLGIISLASWQSRLVGIAHGLKRVPAYISVIAGLLVIGGLAFAGGAFVPFLQL